MHEIFKFIQIVTFLVNFGSCSCKGGTIIFLEGAGGGGGYEKCLKKYLQGLKRQNKLIANIVCVKNSLRFEKNVCRGA